MKLKFLMMITLLSNTIHSQNVENKNDIIAIGYFLKPINPKPILFLIFNTSDTLKIVTNKTEKMDKIIIPSMIESLDVSNTKKAILLKIKNENWQYVYSNKKHIDSLDMTLELKKYNDTIHINNSKNEFKIEKYRKLFIGDNHLIIRENGINYYDNNTKLLIKTTEFETHSDDFTNLKIGYNEAKKIIEPIFTIDPHSSPHYSFIFDISTNKIIWLAQVDKYIANNTPNEYGGKLYLNKKGQATSESIEIDAMTGKVITQQLNDDVEIRIR
jgi:hypothetical protein